MFDKVGFYRTRDGETVEVVQIADPRFKSRFPLKGFDSKGEPSSWDLDGKADYVPSGYDLIEYLGPTKPKQKRMVTKTVERWENIYHNGTMCIYGSKEQADRAATSGRIACVKLTGTYEVEEEVDE